MCATCREILSAGLDLCVRARKMDAQDRTTAQMEISSAPTEWWTENLGKSTRSGTIALWIEDQYEHDLAAWERRARDHLMQCGGAD